MKNIRNVCFLCFISLFCTEEGLSKTTQPQNPYTVEIVNGYRVVRGERPPVNLNALSAEAYEPGVLLIKFSEGVFSPLDRATVKTNAEGIVQLSMPEIDALNVHYGATKAEQSFLSPAFNHTFTERHKAWGFNRWYRLEFDAGADVIEMVQAYIALKEVEVAEPEYKKSLISDSDLDKQINALYSGDGFNRSWTPNDPLFDTQWHYHNTGQETGTPGADIDLIAAWEIEKGHADVVVAIIDDGIQFDHPDLAGSMWQNVSGHYGYNFVNNNPTIIPGNHGTHVAGTVGAVSNNSVGVAGVAGGSGTGDGVRLMSCQIFMGYSIDGTHLAPVWAADNGAAISQNSWGYNSPDVYNQSELDAIDYFNENGGGNVMTNGITIFASGNSNASGNIYPGYYSGAMAVANTNNRDVKSNNSNYGTWIDISAPGGESLWGPARGVKSTITGDDYGFMAGTSMACPHVSGVAALLLSYAHRNGVTLESSEVWHLLVDNVDDIYPQNPGFVGQLGSGRLNAMQALSSLDEMLFGVTRPYALLAAATSTESIELEWVKNPDNDEVMVVWAESNHFGEPEDGTAYSIGETLPGGGTVIYRGDETSFEHTGLNPATTYFYRAFSYTVTDAYSSGRNARATSFCLPFISFPFGENFNSSPPIPVCWESIDHIGNGKVWQFGTHNDGLNETTDNYAFLNSHAYGSGKSQDADLVSPVYDFSNHTDVHLSFTHYFRQKESTSTATLSYTTDNEQSWVQVEQWTTTTANPASFNQAFPELDGESHVRFKWNYTGTYGYYWNVDDVHIAATPIPGKKMDIKVFLEGPYLDSEMGTGLNSQGVLPLGQPYETDPWNYSGTEAVDAIPSGMVDWVLVDLRMAKDAASATAATSLDGWPRAFLLNDQGQLMTHENVLPRVIIGTPEAGPPAPPDGYGQIGDTPTDQFSDSLYIVIRHRNHLDVMSSEPITFSGNSYTYDFTDAITKAHGGAAGYKEVGTGVYGLVAGDIDADGNVSVLDFSAWASAFGMIATYHQADIDMDGGITVLDFSKWAANFGINPVMGVLLPKYFSMVPID